MTIDERPHSPPTSALSPPSTPITIHEENPCVKSPGNMVTSFKRFSLAPSIAARCNSNRPSVHLSLANPSFSQNPSSIDDNARSSRVHTSMVAPSRQSQLPLVKGLTGSLTRFSSESNELPSPSLAVSRTERQGLKGLNLRDDPPYRFVQPSSHYQETALAPQNALYVAPRLSPETVVAEHQHLRAQPANTHWRTTPVVSTPSSGRHSRFPPSKDNRRHKITSEMFMDICANGDTLCFEDPCIRCRTLGLACLMPTLKQVIGRPRPTCWECKSAQSPHDANICSFSDLLRYPRLQSRPASVPRLLAVSLPPPSSSVRPNNRARAADRRRHSPNAPRVTLRLPPPKTSIMALSPSSSTIFPNICDGHYVAVASHNGQRDVLPHHQMCGTKPLETEHAIRDAIISGGEESRQAREQSVHENSYSVRSPYLESSPLSPQHNDVDAKDEIVGMDIEGTDYVSSSHHSRVFGMSETGSQPCSSFEIDSNDDEAEEHFVTKMLTTNL